MTTIIDLHPEDTALIEALTPMVYAAFQVHSPTWLPSITAARAEILEALEPGKINRILIDELGHLLGWIGVIPHNQGRVWEIHPMMVAPQAQGRGYGRMLVEDIEQLAQRHGVLTLSVGTSDETEATTLSGIDLYTDPAEAMADIRCLKPHPYSFYAKCGFTLVGLMPDAEGLGKPGLTLAKAIHSD